MKKFSEFLDDPKNRLILWILTGIIIFLVGISSSKADIVSSKFMNTTNNAVAKDHYSSGEEYTYTRNYVLVDDYKEVFFGYTYCATGSYEFTIPSDIEGKTIPIGIYDSGVRCNTDQSGYYGTSYTFYFAVLNWHDAGDGTSSVMFNLHLRNPEAYSSLISGLGVFVADYIPASVQYQTDYSGSFNSLQNSLNSIASNQNSLSSQQQQILQQQQAIIAEQQNTTQAVEDVNDTLNDDDTTGATDEASDFFSSFSTDTFGLTSIITAPLNLIQSLTSSTCTPLHIPLPYLNNKYIDLPCMTSIYQSAFGSFFTMYQTITFGIIAYWVCVRIFNKVKDFKNPEHDEIEVLDL